MTRYYLSPGSKATIFQVRQAFPDLVAADRQFHLTVASETVTIGTTHGGDIMWACPEVEGAIAPITAIEDALNIMFVEYRDLL